eukprot:COSAG05_NODE_74_length_21769_cov_194.316290_3_plen_54_part_00
MKLHEHFKEFCPGQVGWTLSLVAGLAMLLSQFIVMNCTVSSSGASGVLRNDWD